jgi:DNA polymerase III, gamma/tau subunits
VVKFVNALRESDAYKFIKHDIDHDALAHAYMLISPDPVAVRELFSLVACAVYCENDACLDCRMCSKVLNNNHADIRYINELEDNIKAEAVDELISDANVKPYESLHKLYFVYSADKMNATSQNRLLKTLEEPPASVTIFLGVSRESAMLETIRSRTRKIYLDRFSEDVIYNEIFALCADEPKSRIASVCADGMLGRALQIAKDDNYLNIYDKTVSLLSRLKKSSDVASFLGDKDLVDKNLPVFLDVLSLVVRDLSVVNICPKLMFAKHREAELIALSEGFSVRALGNIQYLINNERKKLEANVERQGVFENLLFGILEVKYKCRQQ